MSRGFVGGRISSRALALLAGLAALAAGPFELAAQEPAPAGSGPAILVGETVRVSGDDEPYPHVEPTLAVDPTDPERLVAAAMTFPVEGEGSRVRVYVSGDGGASWRSGRPGVTTDRAEPSSTRHSGDHPRRAPPEDDPQVAFGPDGTVYLSHLPGRVWRSEDGGRTWLGPAVLPTDDGGLDYPVMAVRGDGTVFIAASQGYRGSAMPPATYSVSVFRSDDGGRSFAGPVRIQPNNFNNQSGDVLVRPDGSVLVTLHEISAAGEVLASPRLWTLWSDDGASFSLPHLAVEGFIAVGPELALEPVAPGQPGPGRRIYAAWAGLRGTNYDNWVAWSDDGGATWEEPTRVTFAGTDRYATRVAIAVDDEGTVGLFWKERRSETGEDCFEPVFTASVDRGRTFLEPVVLGPTTCGGTVGNRVRFNARGRTVGERWRSGGDYEGLVALPGGGFRAVWADSRTGTFQLYSAPVSVRR